MIKKIIFMLLVMAIFVPSVSATLTYPNEYYELRNLSISTLKDSTNSFTVYSAIYNVCTSIALEVRSQTILMEKQNELLDEHNALMRQQMNSTFVCTQFYEGLSSLEHFKCYYEVKL